MSLGDLDRRVHLGIAAVIATAFFVLLTLAFIATPGTDGEPVGGAEDFDRLADAIFDTHVLALEALGILLTAALIGAMVIARPLGTQPDAVHYATKRHGHTLEDIQAISDVERNLGDAHFTVTPLENSDALDAGGEEE